MKYILLVSVLFLSVSVFGQDMLHHDKKWVRKNCGKPLTIKKVNGTVAWNYPDKVVYFSKDTCHFWHDKKRNIIYLRK